METRSEHWAMESPQLLKYASPQGDGNVALNSVPTSTLRELLKYASPQGDGNQRELGYGQRLGCQQLLKYASPQGDGNSGIRLGDRDRASADFSFEVRFPARGWKLLFVCLRFFDSGINS
jgi:hypothetical protein